MHTTVGRNRIKAVAQSRTESGFEPARQLSPRGKRPLAALYIQTYADGRVFSWDERKSEAKLVERGFDFDFASAIFSGPTLEREDTRRNYGEQRVVAIGTADGIPLVVVYTDRATPGGLIERRVISARRASTKERIAHEEAIKAQDPESRPRGP